MKILLSPAKLMSLEHQAKWQITRALFSKHSEEIMNVLKNYKPKDLENLMKISSELGEINNERNKQWKTNPKADNAIPAILAFKGEVYKGLDAESLNVKAKNYLKDNLFILSGLYGLLRPTDAVMLYRLEMGSKLNVNGSKNLYNFWKETITTYVNSQTKKNEIILNLASIEYSKVLDQKKLIGKLINVNFMDYKNDKLTKIMIYFKQARGEMARYCAENNVQSLDDIKKFAEKKYRFDDHLSSENNLVFTR